MIAGARSRSQVLLVEPPGRRRRILATPDRQSRVPRARVSLALVGLLAAACSAGCGRDRHPAGTAAPSPAGERPHLVLVTIDTLRADRVGAYGYQAVETPVLDRLAGEGVRFTGASTTVPFTLPAHCSMMTGRYPPAHGVRENVGYVLGEDVPTLAGLLRAGGYATAAFVSAFVLDGRWGIARGFDHYHDDFDAAETARGNLGSVQRDGAETVAAATAWLDGRPAGEPFFLWVHLFEPHDPYEPPEPFRSRHPGRPYDGEVAYADSLVGRLREALAQRDLLEGAVLVVTGDHGEGLGDHGEAFHGFFLYDSTVRVPLLVRAPGVAGEGRVVAEAVSHVDLLPTLLELAGLPPPPDVDGRSLVALLRGEAAAAERLVYSESLYPLLHYGWAPLRAVRARGHKFIAAPAPELYDLAEDPRERRNVARAHQRLTRDLRAGLDELRTRIERDTAPAAPAADLDEETLRQLRALGYVAGRGEISPEAEDAVARADPKDKIELHRLVMAAQSALGTGDEPAAEARLREALAQDPGLLDAHQMLASIAAQGGRDEEAAESFRRALEIDPEHRASLFGLANAYRRQGRVEDALVGFQRLLALEPHDSKAALAAADLLVGAGRRPEALAVLERAASGRDAPPLLHSQLGELLVLSGRRPDARRHFEAAIAGNPELAAPHFNLAVLLEEDGDLEAAAAAYHQAIERAPRHYQAQFNLGRLYGALGQPDRQQELWAAAVQSNPDFVRGYFFLGKLLMDRGGDLRRAEALTRDGLARDADHGQGALGYFLLADILNRSGRPREAGEALRRAHALQETADSGGG